MRALSGILLLIIACPLAPEHISAEDAGLSGDAGIAADGGDDDAGSVPLDAGSEDSGPVDAGTPDTGAPLDWSIGLSQTVFGQAHDADPNTEAFEVRIDITGPANSSFMLVIDGAMAANSATDDHGQATITTTFEHGDAEISLAHENNVEEQASIIVDLIPPSGRISTNLGRRPMLDITGVDDDDDAGSEQISEAELQIDGGEAIPVDLEARSIDLSHFSIGAHHAVLVLRDEAGNEFSLGASFDTSLSPNHEPIQTGQPLFRPCVGLLNADNLADIVFNDRGGLVHVLAGQNLDMLNDLPVDARFHDGDITNPTACAIGLVDGERSALVSDSLRTVLGDDRYPQLVSLNFNGNRDADVRARLRGDLRDPMLGVHANIAFAPAMMGTPRGLDGVVMQRAPNFLRLYRQSRIADEMESMSNFQTEIDISLPDTLPPRHLVNGDFDGNGSTDFLVAIPAAAGGSGAIWARTSAMNDNMSHAFSDGNATFTAAGNEGAVRFPTAIGFDDQAGDDLVVTNDDGSTITVITAITSDAPQAMGLRLPLNFGTVLDMTACDLTGDDRDELVVGTTNGLWIRSTAGVWAQHPYPHGANAVVCDGDITGDGRNDLVVTNLNDWLTVLH